MTNLAEQCNSIDSRNDLASFVRMLRQDLHDNPASWENATLETFLAALAAWIEDMDGYYEGQGRPIPRHPEWKTVGDMLLAAKMYE